MPRLTPIHLRSGPFCPGVGLDSFMRFSVSTHGSRAWLSQSPHPRSRAGGNGEGPLFGRAPEFFPAYFSF